MIQTKRNYKKSINKLTKKQRGGQKSNKLSLNKRCKVNKKFSSKTKKGGGRVFNLFKNRRKAAKAAAAAKDEAESSIKHNPLFIKNPLFISNSNSERHDSYNDSSLTRVAKTARSSNRSNSKTQSNLITTPTSKVDIPFLYVDYKKGRTPEIHIKNITNATLPYTYDYFKNKKKTSYIIIPQYNITLILTDKSEENDKLNVHLKLKKKPLLSNTLAIGSNNNIFNNESNTSLNSRNSTQAKHTPKIQELKKIINELERITNKFDVDMIVKYYNYINVQPFYNALKKQKEKKEKISSPPSLNH